MVLSLLSLLAMLTIPFHANAEETFTDSVGIKLRLIPYGINNLGTEGGDFHHINSSAFDPDHQGYSTSDDSPAHPIVISKPFYLGAHEITVGQFRQFVEATGYQTTAEKNGKGILGWIIPSGEKLQRNQRPFEQKAEFTWKNPGFEQSDTHPVVGVSWDDAQAFLKWISDKEDSTYRLPTEAEWEYACRSGEDFVFSWGNHHRGHIHEHANVVDADAEEAHKGFALSCWYVSGPGDGAVYTNAVGSYRPNPWGIHDMHGNVWEWCDDMYHETIYKRAGWHDNRRDTFIDPHNTSQRWNVNEGYEWRCIRGGAWNVSPMFSATRMRGYHEQKDATCYTGFRVAREASAQQQAKGTAWTARWQAARDRLPQVEGLSYRDTHANFLGLHFNQPPTAEDLKMLRSLRRVHSLQLNVSNDALTPKLIESIAHLKDLVHLQFHHCNTKLAGDAYKPLRRLTKLRHFIAWGHHPPTLETLAKFPWLSKLETLEFGNSDTNDATLETVRGLRFDNLVELTLGRTSVTGTGLDVFVGAPIKRLRLRILSDDGSRKVGRFRTLEEFYSTEPTITGTGLDQLVGLDKLTTLGLYRLDQLGDGDFSAIAGMKKLRALNVKGSGAGDQTAKHISKLMLTELSIGSPAFTDEGMKTIGGIASLKRFLSIDEDAKITDAGITHLWAPKWLEQLEIRLRDSITGKTFETVSELSRLRFVKIWSADFTDEGLRYLGYLPNVEQVQLGVDRNGPRGVTDEGLLLLAEAPKLRQLDLFRTNCPVTDQGIQRLKEKAPLLKVNLRE